MNLLGIQFADSGKKAARFGKEVKALGLVLDLTKFHLGEVRICHADQRIEELDHTLNDILTRDCLEPAAAESLRGRLHWFTSFLFGRRTCQALRTIGKRATSSKCPKSLDPDLRDALSYVKDVALRSEPLVLNRAPRRTFLILKRS